MTDEKPPKKEPWKPPPATKEKIDIIRDSVRRNPKPWTDPPQTPGGGGRH